jgi:hypothetical protein
VRGSRIRASIPDPVKKVACALPLFSTSDALTNERERKALEIGTTQSAREHYARVKSVFAEAAELGDEERSAYLDRMCAGDARLREDVELLLAAHTELRTDPDRAWPSTRVPDSGTVVYRSEHLRGVLVGGKYRIDDLLGEGGLGVVYRATQMNLERPVALKVIRGSIGSDSVAVRRFQREALAVARLKHPHIVTVHDFGDDSDMGAYLVNERGGLECMADALSSEIVRGPGAARCRRRAAGDSWRRDRLRVRR